MIRCARLLVLVVVGCTSGAVHPPSADSATDATGLSDATGASDATGGTDGPTFSNDLGRVYSTNVADFFGAPRCPALGARLCEDFEAGTSGSAPSSTWWTVSKSSSSTVTIDSAHVARGQKSLHLHTVSNGYANIFETVTFPVLRDHFFGRMFVWATAIPTSPANAHWTLVEARGTGTNALIREGGQFDKFGTGSDQGETGDWTNVDKDPNNMPLPPTLNHWLCIEWEFDRANSETCFFWDGVEHPSLHATSSVHGGTAVPYVLPTFNKLTLGWSLYQTPTAPGPTTFDFWLDEIAIDDARIGCNN